VVHGVHECAPFYMLHLKYNLNAVCCDLALQPFVFLLVRFVTFGNLQLLKHGQAKYGESCVK